MQTTKRTFLLSSSVLAFLLIGATIGAYAQTPLQFVSATPCRVADTRLPNGPFGGPPIQGGTARSFAIPQGACSIPVTAAAYSLNVTVVPHGALGYLTVWPTGETQPNSSTMNSLDGRIKANAAIVSAGSPDEAISVYASNTTDVVLDIDGYFVPATDADLAFYPLTPCRVADTRNPNGNLGGPFLQGNHERDFPVLDSSCIPQGVTPVAYSLNFTAVPHPNGQHLGYLTVWPTGEPQPGVSTLNNPTGTTVANAAIVTAGTTGQISVFPSDNTNLVIDIDGYFAPPQPSGLALFSLTTCRVLDTRQSGGVFNGELTVNVLGSPCGLPSSAASYVFNATVVPQGALQYLTLWPNGQGQPLASTLNAPDGAITSNMAIVPTDNGKIDAFADGSTQLILDIASYFAPLPLLNITTTSLPNGTSGQAYPQTQLLAAGGEPPYSWAVTNGNLPTGLTLSGAGVISGTPTTAGIFTFTVKVTDALADTASANLTITIQGGTLVVITTSLPNGTVSVAYNATLGAGGGVPPYTWSIVTGTLPDGLTLDAGSGLISGMPTTAGVSNFTAQVQDSDQQVAQQTLQIVVNAATNNSALTGPYAFSFNGFSAGKPIFMAGSFIADGNGHLTGGVLDYNGGSGSPPNGHAFTGNYTITANGLGTMVFNADLGTLNFHVAVSELGNGTLIQDNQDPNARGSGTFYVQTITDFRIPPAGGYAIGTFGATQAFNRYAKAGAFQVDTIGTVSDGTEDVDQNGLLSNRDFTGHFRPPVPPFGRGQATLSFPNGVTNNYEYYVVSKEQFIMIGTDPLSSQDPLTIASFLVQPSGGFTNASLSGVSAVELSAWAQNGPNRQADVTLGLFNADGAGNATASLDENLGGTLMQQQVSQGTYSVATNGKVTLTGFGGNPPIFYLSNPDQAFVVGQDSAVTSGIVEPQTAIPPYNNLSIFGTYLGGTTTPVASALVDSVSWLFADGNGNINGIENTSGPNGIGTQNLAATYQVDATGRAVVTGTPAGIMYVISAKKVVLLPSGNNPVLQTFNAASTN
jgi:hypothetical protein